MKRLTDGMIDEMATINHRVNTFQAQFVSNVPLDQDSYALSRLNSQHGDELQTYKIRLENLYSETDVKEQTFQDFQTYFWNLRGFSGDFYPMEYSLKQEKDMESLSERKTSCIKSA